MNPAASRRLFHALALVAVLAAVCLVAPAGAAVSDDALEGFRAFARQEMKAQKIPGMTIGFRHGDTTWVEGFGFADLENQVAASPESAYRLASVTKTMTAIGVLALVEQGKIDLDAEVQAYVDYFPKKEHPVTVRQLLGHLGGMSHYRNYELEGHFKDQKNTRQSIAVFEEFELIAEPGTAYNYSSYGYNLLGAVIEGASGQSFGDFMRETLWQPLGMNSTGMDDPDAIIPNRVRGYRVSGGGELIHSEFVNISSRFAAGGTRSTVPDLLSYTAGLKPGRVLSEATLDEMWTSMVSADGQPTGYGMGWNVMSLNGRFAVAHGGAQAETRTFLMYLPTEDLALAVAMNFEGGDRMPFVRKLAALALGESLAPAAYAGDRSHQAVYDALDTMYEEGASYLDRHGQAATGDADALAAAFSFVNDSVKKALGGKDADDALAALDRGLNVNEGAPLRVAGSFMAAHLAAEMEPVAYAELRAGGPVPFMARYAASSRSGGGVPKVYRLDKSFAGLLSEWNADWQRTWSGSVKDLDMASAIDIEKTMALLTTQFAGASIYPGYWRPMQSKVETAYQNRQIPVAMQLIQAGRELYPELDGPHFYSGLMSLTMGDMETATGSISRARELDPDGMASSGSLNGWAYRFKSIGMVDAGLAVLTIARQLYPADANLVDSTAEMHLAKGDTEQAVALYEKVLNMDPQLESAQKALAELKGNAAVETAEKAGKD